MALRLTMAFSDNPRVQPLRDGTVKPQNIELECITLDPSTIFQRNLSYDEFDVSEMSISETLLAKERREQFGEGKWDWSALPVFLSRGHVWDTLYVNAASGITGLADLKGKRIGVPDYDMTAALWFRITLKDLYGIEAKDNVWYNGRTKELSHGGALGLDKAGPVGVTHHWLTVDQTLDVMLERGDIDACTAIRQGSRVTAGDPTVIDRYGGTPISGNPRLRKLLEDGGRGVVYEYYRKTGFFHCNHNVIVQNRILREHPWVALELYNAFQRSKEVAYERARRAQSAYLYFPGKDFQEQATVLGEDPYPIGLRAMGKNIERAIQGSLEQGLLTKPLRLEDIYYRTTLKT
jgi:4,5-dihydroxyphthalate decarboxylase